MLNSSSGLFRNSAMLLVPPTLCFTESSTPYLGLLILIIMKRLVTWWNCFRITLLSHRKMVARNSGHRLIRMLPLSWYYDSQNDLTLPSSLLWRPDADIARIAAQHNRHSLPTSRCPQVRICTKLNDMKTVAFHTDELWKDEWKERCNS